MLFVDRLALDAARRAAEPLRLLPVHVPTTPLPEVVESNTESAWQLFDAATLQLDFAGQSERLAWTR